MRHFTLELGIVMMKFMYIFIRSAVPHLPYSKGIFSWIWTENVWSLPWNSCPN